MKWFACTALASAWIALAPPAQAVVIAPGGRYAGQVVAQVQPAAGTPKSERGRATAVFEGLGGGRSRLDLSGSLRQRNDAGFVVVLAREGAGWRSQGPGLALHIAADGRIDGGGTLEGRRIRLDGRMDAEQLRLTVETLSPPTQRGGKAGTRIVFVYTLGAQQAKANTPKAPSANAGADPQKKMTCKRRVWQTRNVASPNGTMTMIQVPVCKD